MTVLGVVVVVSEEVATVAVVDKVDTLLADEEASAMRAVMLRTRASNIAIAEHLSRLDEY